MQSSSSDIPAARGGDRTVRTLTPSSGGVFDFNVLPSFAHEYLSTYYSGEPTPDERVVIEFLMREYSRIREHPVMIEIGCGPTLHHVLPAAPYVSEIHMADYLRENLEEVRKWKEGDARAHDWNKFTGLTLRYEGLPSTPHEIRRRESDVREKITELVFCDLKQNEILGTERRYSAVGSFYCTEEVGVTLDEWERVMARLARIVAPGGHLFFAGLRDTDFYSVSSPGGDHLKLPCARITERDVERALSLLGFDMERTVVEGRVLQGQEEEGVLGVVLAAAQKHE